MSRGVKISLLVIGIIAVLVIGAVVYGYSYIKNYPQTHPEQTLSLGERASNFIDKITLPLKLAKLSKQPQDAKLEMPVYGVKVADVTDTWHLPRPDERVHEGQDIFALQDTPVFSATKGYVIKIYNDNLGGQAVIVEGGAGVQYYYAHLDRYPDGLHVGQQVTTDTVIGFVGNTGDAETTPTHLHFGMYLEPSDQAVNPLPLIVDR